MDGDAGAADRPVTPAPEGRHVGDVDPGTRKPMIREQLFAVLRDVLVGVTAAAVVGVLLFWAASRKDEQRAEEIDAQAETLRQVVEDVEDAVAEVKASVQALDDSVKSVRDATDSVGEATEGVRDASDQVRAAVAELDESNTSDATQLARLENLRFVRSSEVNDLGPRKFAGLDLAGMNLSATLLGGADFSSADFRGTDLQFSDLNNSNLSLAEFGTLGGAEMADVGRSGSDNPCSNRPLTLGTNLIHTDLSDSLILGARFDGTEMFCMTNLTGANITGSDLSALASADLSDPEVVDLNGVRWRCPIWFIEYDALPPDEQTRWPDDFTPPDSAPCN